MSSKQVGRPVSKLQTAPGNLATPTTRTIRHRCSAGKYDTWRILKLALVNQKINRLGRRQRESLHVSRHPNLPRYQSVKDEENIFDLRLPWKCPNVIFFYYFPLRFWPLGVQIFIFWRSWITQGWSKVKTDREYKQSDVTNRKKRKQWIYLFFSHVIFAFKFLLTRVSSSAVNLRYR